MKDYRNLEVTGANAVALEHFETGLACFQTYTGDPIAAVDAAIAAAPGFNMAQLFKAELMLSGTEKGGANIAAGLLAQITGPVNNRERVHLLAAEALVRGEFEQAVDRFEDILIDHPHDALALQMAHLYDLYRGDSRSLRDRPARVLHNWSADMPGYHAVLGMHAFGLEECGDYARAESRARAALALNSRDSWAHHAVAHVCEMQGRSEDGLAWMLSRETEWSEGSFMAVHNWWHRALFHLELDDIDSVLRLYDERIRVNRSPVALDLIDASALLWRLKLRGIDGGHRWAELAEAWLAAHPNDDFHVFNGAHMLMAQLGAGRERDADAQLAAIEARMRSPGSNQLIIRDAGLAICRALASFARGEYADCVTRLRPKRHYIARFGGSHAQRDVIDLTLLEAARRDGQRSLTRALAAERLALKPNSALAQRYASAA